MSNVSYLHQWNPDLCIDVIVAGAEVILDFNRPLYKLFRDENRHKDRIFPTTKDVQQGKFLEYANRTDLIFQLKSRFDEALEEGTRQASLNSYFKTLIPYILWCDQEDVLVFTQISIEGYMNAQNEKVMRGEMKSSTYHGVRKSLHNCFIE